MGARENLQTSPRDIDGPESPVTLGPSAAGRKPFPRPNILWLVTEDNTCNYTGPYGDPCARTPHLDRLAAEGIVFENAHCVAPVCAPSRSSIITGCHAGGLGTQHMRSARPLPPGVRFFPEFLREAGYFCANHLKTDYNTSSPFAAAWDLCGETAHWRRRRAGQPFFAVFNFMESHESGLFTRRPLVTDPALVRVPSYLPDTPETRGDLAQYYDCVSRADEAIGGILAQLAEDGLGEDTIIFYYADHGGCLPRSKRFLYDNGTHVPLIVRFPDRFQPLAPDGPGTRIGDVVSHLDLAPTVLALAGIPRPGQFQGRSFAGPAPGPAPSFVSSCRGRMDERYDFSGAVTDGRFRYVRNYFFHRPAGQHVSYLWNEPSMRRFEVLGREGRLDRLQRAFFEPRAAEELFDCRADPDNVRNLAAEPGFAPILERLRAAHRGQMIRVRDTGFFPEAMMVAEAAGRSPALAAADAERYPIRRLLDFVDACQLGHAGPETIAAAMRDPAPVLRYWAATCALQRGNLPEVAALLADRDGSVRVAAAEAVLRAGPHPGAWERLAEALAADQPDELRLAVLNALPFLPAGPPAVRAGVATAAAEGSDPAEAARAGTEIGSAWKSYLRNAARYLIERRLA